MKVAQLCPTLCDFMDCIATPWTIYSPWNSPGQNTGVGSLSLLQGIFPTQGSNPEYMYKGERDWMSLVSIVETVTLPLHSLTLYFLHRTSPEVLVFVLVFVNCEIRREGTSLECKVL